jgi:predicted nucleic acid-binding Zn ribbon protein
MARSDFHDLKGALAKALGSTARVGRAGGLQPLWREVVGALADHSRPTRLDAGILVVEASPEFLFDLQRSNDLLLERLQARLGRETVRALRFLPTR